LFDYAEFQYANALRVLNAAGMLKSISGQIQDGERRPNWTCLNRNFTPPPVVGLRYNLMCVVAGCASEVKKNCWIFRLVYYRPSN